MLRRRAFDALRNVPAERRVEAVKPPALPAHAAARRHDAGSSGQYCRGVLSPGRAALTTLVLLTGLSLSWLLVSSELAREQDQGCLTYREPTTGRSALRHCWNPGASGAPS